MEEDYLVKSVAFCSLRQLKVGRKSSELVGSKGVIKKFGLWLGCEAGIIIIGLCGKCG